MLVCGEVVVPEAPVVVPVVPVIEPLVSLLPGVAPAVPVVFEEPLVLGVDTPVLPVLLLVDP